MSNAWKDSVTGDVLYPDDLEGRNLELVSEGPIDAENVDHDDANYGMWMRVSNGERKYWAVCPSALREEFGEVEAEPGHAFRVESIEKGPKDHDPYEIEIVHEPTNL